MSTIFRKVINKELPADIIYEDENYLAFKDINPKADFHILIIPKLEIDSFHNIKSDKEIEITAGLLKIASKITKERKLNWCRLQINSWANHWQEVFHIHLHLMSGLH